MALTNYDTPQARNLIGKNADKYIGIFNDIAAGNKPPFNSTAWCLGGLWLYSKKATPTGGAKMVAFISIILLLFAWSGVGTVLWLGWDLIIGKNGNEWFKQSIDAKLPK